MNYKRLFDHKGIYVVYNREGIQEAVTDLMDVFWLQPNINITEYPSVLHLTVDPAAVHGIGVLLNVPLIQYLSQVKAEVEEDERKDWLPRVPHYVLLKMEVPTKDDRVVYLVVVSNWAVDEDLHHLEYYYEDHTCPTNYLGVEIVAYRYPTGEIDGDPHGIFRYVSKVTVEEGDRIINARNPACPQGNELNRLTEHLLSLNSQEHVEHLVNKSVKDLIDKTVADVTIGHLSEEDAKQGWSWPITVTFSDNIP